MATPFRQPNADVTLTRRDLVHASLVALAILSPALLFPLGTDFGMFVVAGRKILQGAVMYRDVVDLKPPLIYHLYALALAVFGGSWHAIRVFDFILQAAAGVGLFALIRRTGGGRIWGWAALVGYTASYVSLGFSNTAMAETFAAAPAIGMLALQIRRRTPVRSFFVGVLGGVLFVLKYTLAAPLIVAAIAEATIYRPSGRPVRNILLMALGSLFPILAFVGYLTVFDAWRGFSEINDFTAGYALSHGESILAIIRESGSALGFYFSSNYSIAMSFATAIGMVMAFQRAASDSRRSNDSGRLLVLASYCFLAMLVSVLIETKFRAFHMARLLPYGAIVAGAGAQRAVEWWRGRHYGRVASIAAVVVAAIASPAVRYVWHGSAALATAEMGPRGFDWFYYNELRGFTVTEIDNIASYIRSERRSGDRIFVMSGMAGLIHEMCGSIPDNRIFHAAFLIAPYAPPVWRTETDQYLLRTRPRFIVVHRNERMFEMTRSSQSSDEALRALPGVDAMIRNEYYLAVGTKYFDVFERRE